MNILELGKVQLVVVVVLGCLVVSGDFQVVLLTVEVDLEESYLETWRET